jgi:uncharacterized protein YunC (DUF1805 family)
MDQVTVSGQRFEGLNILTENSALLMIKGAQGFLGCGWFSIETADKLNERVAIVKGVQSYDDMLSASVVAVSAAAAAAGAATGMTGAEALLVINAGSADDATG